MKELNIRLSKERLARALGIPDTYLITRVDYIPENGTIGIHVVSDEVNDKEEFQPITSRPLTIFIKSLGSEPLKIEKPEPSER